MKQKIVQILIEMQIHLMKYKYLMDTTTHASEQHIETSAYISPKFQLSDSDRPKLSTLSHNCSQRATIIRHDIIDVRADRHRGRQKQHFNSPWAREAVN